MGDLEKFIEEHNEDAEQPGYETFTIYGPKSIWEEFVKAMPSKKAAAALEILLREAIERVKKLEKRRS